MCMCFSVFCFDRYRQNAHSTCSAASETNNPCENVGSWWGDYKEDTLSCDTPLKWGQGNQLKNHNPANSCNAGASGLNIGMIVGVVVASIFVLILSICIICRSCAGASDSLSAQRQIRATRPPPPRNNAQLQRLLEVTEITGTMRKNGHRHT